MDSEPLPIYKKHNSFVEIRHQHDDKLAQSVLQRIANVRQKPELASKLSAAHADILQQVYSDLFDPANDKLKPRFVLSPNVVEEIATYPDEVLPRYLVHRYRYEIFPQLQKLDDYPPYLQIEPSSICNFRCVFCFETDKEFTKRSNGYMGYMALETFREVIDQAQGCVEFISIASRGEPLLCPDIEPMLAYTRGKFLNLKLNTNASLLDERKCHALLQSGVKTLVFSADAAAEPLYSQLRVGGDLAKVLANVELFQNIRTTQYSGSQMITRVSGVKVNAEQDLDKMEKTWGGLADQVAFVNYNPWENTYQRAPSRVNAPCSDLWRRMFVWWDGKVNPCDVDYRSTLSVGSLSQHNLSEAWRSEAYMAVRHAHANEGRSSISPCNRCSVV